jgi:ribokinase
MIPGPQDARPRIMVVGAINVDLVVTADQLPHAGETVVGAGPARHGGGKGANAALAAARAGAHVSLVGAVGRDAMADVALADLQDGGVALDGVASLREEPTGVALIVVDRTGENQIAVGAGANAALDAAWVADQVRSAIRRQTRCILVSTEVPDAAVIAAVRAAAAAGVCCVLNTAPPTGAVLDLLDARPLLTPNARELAMLTQLLAAREGTSTPAGANAQAVTIARQTRRPVIVTLGGDGALIATPDGATTRVPAPPIEVVDTTGAGDTFSGVLAVRLAAGDELGDAVGFAVTAASISVTRAGARDGMPRLAEIKTVVAPGPEAVAR